jgi:Domain of unknown function (DUF4278)
MKLTDRGSSYQVPAPSSISSDANDRPKIKLIYRGHTYDYTPPPVIASASIVTDGPVVTLIYRGQTYQRQLPPPQPYQKPRSINWRYQIAEEV